MTPGRRIVLAGLPRSGSTYTATLLGHAMATSPVHEPDNEKEHLGALAAKRGLGRFPALGAEDSAPAYLRLWEQALGHPGPVGGSAQWSTARPWTEAAVQASALLPTAVSGVALPGRRHPGQAVGGPAIVKTVHAVLALDWLAARVPDVTFVVVLRHPANVLASWLDLALPDQDRRLDRRADVRRRWLDPWGVSPPGTDSVRRACWQVCLLHAALLDQVSRHPEWVVVQHEELCRQPDAAAQELAARLGLPWTAASVGFVADSDRPGEGYSLHRRARDLPEGWRSRLSNDHVRVLGAVAKEFPGLEPWRQDLLSETGPAKER